MMMPSKASIEALWRFFGLSVLSSCMQFTKVIKYHVDENNHDSIERYS